jgi:PAS domain S-box-containing protein
MTDSSRLHPPTEPDVSELQHENELLRRQVAELSAHLAQERRQAEVLRAQAELIDLTHDSIIVLDLHDRIIFWNRGAQQIFGWDAQEAIGSKHSALLNTVFPVSHELLKEELISSGRWEGEFSPTRRDGRTLIVASRWTLQRDEAGAPVAILVTSNDITENKSAENALRESEERLKLAIAAGNMGVWEWDIVTGKESWSDVCFRILNLTHVEIENKHNFFIKSIHPEDLPAQQKAQSRAIATRTDYVHEFRILRSDGSLRWVSTRGKCFYDESGHPLRLLGVVTDTTRRKQLEEELFKAQKLESIGVLAGGIAHDFNNLLTAILGNITLARRASRPDDECALLLAEAEKGCLNAKSLTSQLLTFAKGGAPIRETARIGALIRETAGFILRGSPATCLFDIPDDLPPVEIDAGQISQVLQNIVMNAAQSMEKPGTIDICAVRHTPAEDGPPLFSGREYIRISIRDQGKGIPQEHLSRIFDPFFTTKENGTGLGLASSYSIMTHHEGCIQVESTPGAGTTFHLFLPASDSAPVTRESGDFSCDPLSEPARILVMDDDRKIRMVVDRFLKSLGYETVSVGDGTDAITRYREEQKAGAPFHAVIMDLTVPGGMGGKEAMEQLLKIDPAVTAIVSSGYSDDPVMANYREFGFQAVLAKPYQLHDLEQVVRRIVTS